MRSVLTRWPLLSAALPAIALVLTLTAPAQAGQQPRNTDPDDQDPLASLTAAIDAIDAQDASTFAGGVGGANLGGGRHGQSCRPAQLFGAGLFSTAEQWEWRITFSPNRRRAFWTVSDGFFPATRQSTIVTSEWRRGDWSAAETASFSGVHTDIDPFLSPDGQSLFFSSIRPMNGEARTDLDIWVVHRTPRGWSAPIHLGANVNSAGDELYPSVDWWGNLYFGRWKDDGDWDIYRSRRRANGTYAPAEPLGPGVNTPDLWEFNPEISPDGRTLLFTRLVSFTGPPWGELHSTRVQPNGSVAQAKALPSCVNTGADEFHPTVLWDRNLLIFVRNEPLEPVNGDFYVTRLPLR